MARLAFYTFGILREPLGSEVVRPFVELSPKVFAAAEAAPGFIARAVTPPLVDRLMALGAYLRCHVFTMAVQVRTILQALQRSRFGPGSVLSARLPTRGNIRSRLGSDGSGSARARGLLT